VNNTGNTSNALAPVAAITSPQSGASILEGLALAFTGEATGGTPPYTCTWDFDGAAAPATTLAPGEVTLLEPKDHVVTLTVTDSLGLSSQATVTVTVEDIFGEMRPWYGNLHSHSALSDGEGTPMEALTWARDTAGLDFYAMTDHSEMLSESEWTLMQNETDTVNEEGVFVTLRGFEWSHPWNGHMVIFTTEDYNSAYTAIWISFIYDWLEERDALAQFNHPGRENGVFNDLDYEEYMSDNMFAMETGNKGDGNNDGEFLPYYVQALDRGWHIAPTSGQDNHSLSLNSHRSVFLAPALSRESLLNAMRARRFYSSDDPNMAIAFRCGDAWLGDTVTTSAGPMTFQIKVTDDEPIEKLELITAGGAVAAEFTPTEGATSAVWHPEIALTSSGWYFLKVTATDTLDDDGPQQISVTAPIWFTIE